MQNFEKIFPKISSDRMTPRPVISPMKRMTCRISSLNKSDGNPLYNASKARARAS